jgi:hypothetical protein
MSNALSDFENSRAFWPVFILAFPVLFLAIWSFVLWITSHISGWSDLAKAYKSAGSEDVRDWVFRGGGGVYRTRLPFAGARGRFAVGAARDGIVIKPPFVLRPFHPSLFLPFDRMTAEEDIRFLGLDFVRITMADLPGIRIGILKSARETAEGLRG